MDGRLSKEQSEFNRIRNEIMRNSEMEQLGKSMQGSGSGEERSKMAKWARDYAEAEIDKLGRAIQRNRRQVGTEIVWMDEDEAEQAKYELNLLRAAQTQLSNRTAEFAEGLTMDQWQVVIPSIWAGLILEAHGGPKFMNPDSIEDGDFQSNPSEHQAAKEQELITPPVPMPTLDEYINPPEDASSIEAPPEPTLNEILAGIEADNHDE